MVDDELLGNLFNVGTQVKKPTSKKQSKKRITDKTNLPAKKTSIKRKSTRRTTTKKTSSKDKINLNSITNVIINHNPGKLQVEIDYDDKNQKNTSETQSKINKQLIDIFKDLI